MSGLPRLDRYALETVTCRRVADQRAGSGAQGCLIQGFAESKNSPIIASIAVHYDVPFAHRSSASWPYRKLPEGANQGDPFGVDCRQFLQRKNVAEPSYFYNGSVLYRLLDTLRLIYLRGDRRGC